MRSIIDYRYNQLSKQGKQARERECNKEGVHTHARGMKDNKLMMVAAVQRHIDYLTPQAKRLLGINELGGRIQYLPMLLLGGFI